MTNAVPPLMEKVMNEDMQLELAKKIAADAHKGQKDSFGKPYVGHCARMSDALIDTKQKTIAYLHDVIAKSECWSLERLAHVGFDRDILCAIDALTQRPSETETSYLCRVFEDAMAHSVKVEDLKDDLEQAKSAGRDTTLYENGLEFLAGVTMPVASVPVAGNHRAL
ncbi:hypothetical protein FMN50_03475 [Rhodobacterales bacterium]|nr:hypothetical protein FMN50_03475 [Rhodobacterales bacterium]